MSLCICKNFAWIAEPDIKVYRVIRSSIRKSIEMTYSDIWLLVQKTNHRKIVWLCNILAKGGTLVPSTAVST